MKTNQNKINMDVGEKNKKEENIIKEVKCFLKLETSRGRFYLILSCVLIVSLIFVIFEYVSSKPISTQDIAEGVTPSIVGVIQYKRGSLSETGEGSGIIMSSDGYIITNNHVVEGADRLQVVTCDKKKYTAKLVGTDMRTDLAVIKISADNLKVAKLGDSSKCKVGDQVIAIGNPSGLTLAGSVTQGIISAIDRDIDVGNGPMNLIQTDAAINPGNSGGALINTKGEVIAINSAKIAQQGYESIGFSIPMSFAHPIIDNLIENGYVKGRVRLGIKCSMIDDSTCENEKIPKGVYVVDVDPLSDAAKNGVKKDDIIISINNVRMNSTTDLINERDKHQPGDVLTLTIYRRQTFGTVICNVTLLEDKGINKDTSTTAW